MDLRNRGDGMRMRYEREKARSDERTGRDDCGGTAVLTEGSDSRVHGEELKAHHTFFDGLPVPACLVTDRNRGVLPIDRDERMN